MAAPLTHCTHADSGYHGPSRQKVLRSGIRKNFRDLDRAVKEGSSIHCTHLEMNEKKEVKSLINRPWFRGMRGGTQLKLEKEGVERCVARSVVGKGGSYKGKGKQMGEVPKPGKVMEV